MRTCAEIKIPSFSWLFPIASCLKNAIYKKRKIFLPWKEVSVPKTTANNTTWVHLNKQQSIQETEVSNRIFNWNFPNKFAAFYFALGGLAMSTVKNLWTSLQHWLSRDFSFLFSVCAVSKTLFSTNMKIPKIMHSITIIKWKLTKQ